VDLTELSTRVRGQPYSGEPLGAFEQVVTARAGAGQGRGRFQAGGTVSALMTCALAAGMIDGAVLTDRDGFYPRPRLVSDPVEVLECAGSKYMAAPTLAAVNEGRERGYRKLGVAATPCQATSLALRGTNPLERDDWTDVVSLVVGLFCTWALEPRKLEAFLRERMDLTRIRAMDIPPPPAEVLVVDLGDEKTEIPLAQIRPLIPGTCLVCPDMTSEWADLSVGVLEGRPDWNTLIVRTAVGAELLERAVRDGYLETGTMPEAGLDHLKQASAAKKKRAIVRAGELGLLNNDGEGRKSMLRISAEVVERIMA
jgi:coenzyme F420 hydrogenase subunit beta